MNCQEDEVLSNHKHFEEYLEALWARWGISKTDLLFSPWSHTQSHPIRKDSHLHPTYLTR